MERILIFLSGSGLALVIREALSGFLNEAIKDYFAERRRKRIVKYHLGKKILNLITADISDLTSEPPVEQLIKLKQHVYGHDRKLSAQILIYGKVRKMLHTELARISRKGANAISIDDIKMTQRFADELSIMHEGLTIQAHSLMGNKVPRFLLLRLQYLFRKKKLGEEVAKQLNNISLQDLIKKANQS